MATLLLPNCLFITRFTLRNKKRCINTNCSKAIRLKTYPVQDKKFHPIVPRSMKCKRDKCLLNDNLSCKRTSKLSRVMMALHFMTSLLPIYDLINCKAQLASLASVLCSLALSVLLPSCQALGSYRKFRKQWIKPLVMWWEGVSFIFYFLYFLSLYCIDCRF